MLRLLVFLFFVLDFCLGDGCPSGFQRDFVSDVCVCPPRFFEVNSPHVLVDVPYEGHFYSSIHNDNAIGSGHGQGQIAFSGWIAKYKNVNQWIKLDASIVANLRDGRVFGIATKGRSAHNQWVKTYRVETSVDDVTWVDLGVFTGNSDMNTVVAHFFDNVTEVRYVRVSPQTWNNHISMRMGVLVSGPAVSCQSFWLATRNDLLSLISDCNIFGVFGESCIPLQYANVSSITNMQEMFYLSSFNGDISSWDVSSVTTMYMMFRDSSFNGDISSWDVSSVTTMYHLFFNTNFNGDISKWDVSSVTNMDAMFRQSSSFNSDISKWDVSSVTLMHNMFYLSSFNGDISRWDVSSVTNMYRLFRQCPFNTNISSWDVSKVTNMQETFYQATLFSWNISYWDVSKVTNMHYIFEGVGENMSVPLGWVTRNTALRDLVQGCNRGGVVYCTTVEFANVSTTGTLEDTFLHTNFNGDISNWNVSSATNMKEMFRQSQFNSSISKWDVSSVTNMYLMFYLNQKFNGNISEWDVSSVTTMHAMFHTTNFNNDISKWDVSSVTSMEAMFYNNKKFNGNISSWDVTSVTTMKNMFALSLFNSDISSWDVSSVRDISYMFRESSFNGDISSWDVSSVRDMRHMFHQEDPPLFSFNGDISRWNTVSVTSMRYTFHKAYSFNGNISAWDVSSVREMRYMFRDALSFNRDISAWDVSKVADMTYIFEGVNENMSAPLGWVVKKDALRDLIEGCNRGGVGYCTTVEFADTSTVTGMENLVENMGSFNADISRWNTVSVTSMYWTFRNSGFNGDISSWDLSSLVSMYGMFRETSFNSDISGWDVSSVTQMEQMFHKSYFNNNISSWDVSKVTDMESTFNRAYSFNSDISKWDVSSVRIMKYMFHQEDPLPFSFNRDISRWDVSSVTNMFAMFHTSIFNGNISKWDVSSLTDARYMFKLTPYFLQDLCPWRLDPTLRAEDSKPSVNLAGMFDSALMSGVPYGCPAVNFCLSGDHSCNLNYSTCEFNIIDYTCVCNSGYIKNDTSCDDVDECLLSTDDCELKSTCVNTLGSFECHCVEDVVGRGTFTDPCSRNVCNISIPFDGLHARYRASGWDSERNVWFDSSGNSGMDSVSVRGSPVFGSSGSLNFLSGGVGDGFVLGAGSIPEFFTVCSLSRYTSSLTGRILGSTSSGWFHGHDGGFSGAASYGGLLSSGDASATTDWVYMCGRNAESDALVVNGILKRAANGSFSESGGQQLTVNADGSGEHSDWAVSEVLIWDRHLNVTEMLTASDYLRSLVHGCTGGCVSGYEFSTASMSCVDVDECASGLSQCAIDTTRCVNTDGGYDCVEHGCSSLYHPGGTSPCTLDDCNERLVCLVRYCCSLEDDAWGGEDLSDPDCRISAWDTSGVTKLDFLFAGLADGFNNFMCWETFNGDISKWDVSSVTSAYRVFRTSLFDGVRGISGFQGDISKWDVSSVQNMEGFFLGIGNLTSDLSKWNTSSVTSMYYMFQSTVFNGDISSWDVSRVKDMGQMFHSSTFNRDISVWDVSSLESAWQMFRNTQFYEQSLCAWRLEDKRTAGGDTVMGAGDPSFFLDARMYGVLWGCPVDLCLSGSHSCDPQARCDFGVFDYTCSCNAGYTGDGVSSCANVNECDFSPVSCGVNTVCEDTEGSFLCLCVGDSVFVA